MTLLTEYRRSLKRIEVEEMVDLFFYRPLAFLIVKSVYNTKITPDNLTFAAIIMGLTGAALYTPGMPHTTRLGALFIVFFVILDCSDGQLARLKKNGTPAGRLLDGIADYIVTTALFIGIAIGYSRADGAPSNMVILLALSGASIIIQDAFVDYYRMRFLDIVQQRQDTFQGGINEYRDEYERLKKQGGNWFNKGVILLYLVYSGVQNRLTKRKKSIDYQEVPADIYYRKNRVLVRFWVSIGPSAMRTSLIACSLFGRFDIFFWITIGGFNILALLLWIIQSLIDRSYLPRAK
ncbi:MAG: CDP-alcohol phosphatidyltransferase family protein [Bacteroidia bacterium]|nr:MAG: CDP-alcohol phosphatidyltransferase family protein [Bacteroidia bacterium]